MPDMANAVPVNRAAPDTRPWSEIYSPLASQTAKPKVEQITLAQDERQPPPAAQPATATPSKPLEQAPMIKVASTSGKEMSAALPIPVPLPPAPQAAQTAITVAPQFKPKQTHGAGAVQPMPDATMPFRMGQSPRPFGLDAQKVDPVLLASIAPVTTAWAPAEPAKSQVNVPRSPVAQPAAQLASEAKPQAVAALSGKIVMRDLTPTEPQTATATQTAGESRMPPAIPLPPPQNRTWTASAGTSLSDVVRNWGYQANPHWWVVWNTKSDFTIGSPYTIQAPDYLSAAAQLFATARQENHFFTVVKHPNNVLVVSTPTE